MEAAAILAALRQRGISIEARPGGRVRCHPAPPEELKAAILANKPAVLAALAAEGSNRGAFGTFLGTPDGWRCPRCGGTVRMNRGADGWPCARCGILGE